MGAPPASLLLGPLLLGHLSGALETAPLELRYDLRAGDRLVYRQLVERSSRGAIDYRTRYEWRSQLLVLGPEQGGLVVAIQRNRSSAQLLSYEDLEGERLLAERRRFDSELPAARFSETNLVDEQGVAGLAWSAVRETWSEVLPGLHEIEPLPARPVSVGDSFRTSGAFGLEQRAAAVELLDGRRCLRGEAERGSLKLRWWFDLERRQLARLELESEYDATRRRIRERVQIEMVESARGEDVLSWLERAETREAALGGLLLQASRRAPADRLYGLVDPDDPALTRRALALAHHRGLAPPDAGVLAAALDGNDPRVRVLAARLARTLPSSVADPLLERARRDPDVFVREAAAAPEPGPAVQGSCPVPVAAPRPALPGTTLRPMTGSGFEGWPYVIHVPDDYRGDAAFPLLVYLSGGPGRAMAALPSAQDGFAQAGYVVLMPQADRLWWTERSVAIVQALLDETLRRLRIDTDRVYVAGFSNGGSGSYLYAALLPDRFAAAVSLEGAGQRVAPEAASPINLHALPFLFVHGDRDRVVPVSASRDTVAAIRKASPEAPVELRILKGRGHDVAIGSDEGLSLAFLEGRRRDPFPRHVRFALRELRFGRVFWVEVLEKDGGTSEIEARIEPDNVVQLTTKRVRRLRLLLRRELVSPGTPLKVVWNGRPVFSGEFTEDCALLERTAEAGADPRRAWSMELALELPASR